MTDVDAGSAPDPRLVPAIQACRLFAFISPLGKARLVGIASLEHHPRGARLLSPGDTPRALFIVVSGLVRVFKTAPNGKEHVLHLCGPGTTFAEVAVIDDFPVPAFVEVVEPAELLCLDAEAFRRLLREDHEICLQLLPGLGAWVRHLVSLMEDIVLRDAYGRLARWLLERQQADGAVDLPASRKLLASHLNLTPETLSRTMRRLEEDGCIRSATGDRIEILSGQRLHQAAEGLFPTI